MRRLFLALLPVSVWASPDLPDMEMHIFNQSNNSSPADTTLYLRFADKDHVDIYSKPVSEEKMPEDETVYKMEIFPEPSSSHFK